MLLPPVSSWLCSHSARLEVLATQLCALTKPKRDNPEDSSLSSPASCRYSSSLRNIPIPSPFLRTHPPGGEAGTFPLELLCLLQRGCWWGSSTALSHLELLPDTQQCVCVSLKGFWSGWKSCCSCNLLYLLNRNTFMSKQKSLGVYSFF